MKKKNAISMLLINAVYILLMVLVPELANFIAIGVLNIGLLIFILIKNRRIVFPRKMEQKSKSL